MKIRILFLLLALSSAGALVFAQMAEEFNPPRANCCLINNARGLVNSASGLADQLPITDFWNLEQYFPGKSYVNRGIGGQTTPQMLVRMYPDVVALKPQAMVVLAGTNDIARNTGPETAEMIQQNIMAMTELAQYHGIKVVLCAVLPVSDYPFLRSQNAPPAAAGPGGRGGPPRAAAKMTDSHPAADILKLNAWMKDYATKVGAQYADYYTATVDERGWLKDAISTDGLHPNAEGYKAMTGIVADAIQKALAK